MEANWKTTRRRVRREIRTMGSRALPLVEEWFLMDANRKTTKRRMRREIRRIGTRALTLVEEWFLMDAKRKTTRRRVRREIRRMGTRAAGHEVISETKTVKKSENTGQKNCFMTKFSPVEVSSALQCGLESNMCVLYRT